jgi:CheY-like chemotaxis protein
MLGHRTAAAANVREALEVAAERAERFDLLISDLQLPDGDGWELLRRLEEAGRRPRQAIALSGWGNDEDVTKSRTAGFRAHLVKPTPPGISEAAVAKASAAIEDASDG